MILAISIFIFFNLFFLVAKVKNDFSIVDVAWGLSFWVVAMVAAFEVNFELDLRSLIIFLTTSAWAFRLSGYILYRNLSLGHEDYRYQEMREGWGQNVFLNAYFRVFMLQAFLSVVIALPVYFGITKQTSQDLALLDIVGVALWVIGFGFESIADFQKNKFKSNSANQGKVLKTGLWKYSRHPNYFGEALLWWGVLLIAINVVPYYYVIASPILLTFFLLKVSGVALLEKKYDGDSEYDQYKRNTSSFIPWFPRGAHEK